MKQRIAISTWRGRISPLFDSAQQLLYYDVQGDELSSANTRQLTSDQPSGKAHELKALSVNTLICGAISREYAEAISVQQIDIIPFIAGELNTVLQCYLGGRLKQSNLFMPGYRHRRRRGQSQKF